MTEFAQRLIDGKGESVPIKDIERLKTAAPFDGKGKLTARTKVFRYDLPFYKEVELIELRDPSWTPEKTRVFFLRNGDELTRLDGTSPPIHMTNAEGPIKLNDESVAAYLYFFCFFVRGEEGPFLICEDGANRYIPDEARDKIINVLDSVSHFGRSPEGQFQLSASVYYSNAMFRSDFLVSPSGMLEMLVDNPLVTDLPAKVFAPITVTGCREMN